MLKNKINTKHGKINNDKYDYFIAIDWSQKNMAIATLRKDFSRSKDYRCRFRCGTFESVL